MWALIGGLATALPVAAKVGWDVAAWANERASVKQVNALDARVLTLEQANELLREQQRAQYRELAAAWAWERVTPARRGAVVTVEQREAAAERARQHFNRLLVRGFDAPEALRVALRQVDAAR